MSRPKCLRCGAGPEWIQGRAPNETTEAIRCIDGLDAQDIKVAAMNIVNQILDTSGATVEKRQAINDKCYDLAVAVIRQLVSASNGGSEPFSPARKDIESHAE